MRWVDSRCVLAFLCAVRVSYVRAIFPSVAPRQQPFCGAAIVATASAWSDTARPLSAKGGEGNNDEATAYALILACLSTAAVAQHLTPKKPAAQARPKEPMGCKLVGTVKNSDCVAASELHGAVAAEMPSEAIPLKAKKWK
jgi:hypothetical protein